MTNLKAIIFMIFYHKIYFYAQKQLQVIEKFEEKALVFCIKRAILFLIVCDLHFPVVKKLSLLVCQIGDFS